MAGTIGSVSVSGIDREFLTLCDTTDDGAVTPFVRRFSTSPAGEVTTTDTALDGTTPYTPVGDVGLCQAPPAGDVTVHGAQDTAWALSANAGTQAVTLLVYAGTVTVTTLDGALTVAAGTSMSWGVDGDDTRGQLTGTLDIDGEGGASWHVIWTVAREH